MLESLRLPVDLFAAAARSRSAPGAENLLLRQQRAVLTRPIRQRPWLRAPDKRFFRPEVDGGEPPGLRGGSRYTR